MKRVLPILLLLLLLTGCGQKPEPLVATEPVQETQPDTEPVLVSLYDANSEIEKLTQGAVRAYPLGGEDYRALLPMGENLLVVSADGILTVLQGETGDILATEMTALPPDWKPGDLVAGEEGVLYYARESRYLVWLDRQLQEIVTVPLPEESQTDPLLLSSGQVFYCVGGNIHALDLQTGLTRMVREHSYGDQVLTGSCFDGQIITCRIAEENGQSKLLYLKADTGEVVRTDTLGFTLETHDSRYLAQNGSEYIFGDLEGDTMILSPRGNAINGALAQNGAVEYTVTEESLELGFYDFASGKRTGAVSLPGILEPQVMMADQQAVWFVSDSVLYRWEVAASGVTEDTVYTGNYFTAENPDEAGLAACQTQALRLQETYGVELYIWEEAADLAAEYAQDAEYRANLIGAGLDEIEALLAQFPEEMLPTLQNVTFYMVQTLKNGQPSAIYRDGAHCHVILSSQEAAKYFLWGLGFAVDTHVLGNSRQLDTWDDLNPRKFKYTYDYEANALREDWEDDLDYFVDMPSMSFPTEDRSRIFAWSMLPEGEEVLRQDDLQDKLRRLCKGIREAYGLEDSTVVFPWEQYLEKPLAKKE